MNNMIFFANDLILNNARKLIKRNEIVDFIENDTNWEVIDNDLLGNYMELKCSSCGEIFRLTIDYHIFCSKCGAKMKI